MFVSFALNLPQEVGYCYIRAIDRAQAYMGASLIQLLLTTVFNLTVLIVLGLGLQGILWSKVAISLIMAAGMMIYTFRRIPISFDFRLLVRAFRYGAPLGVSGLGFLILHYGDRFFLQRYVSLAEIGIYALAYKLGMIVSFLLMPFEIYWSAQRFNLVKGPKGDKLFVRVCTYELLALTPVVMGLALFSEPLLRIMAGPAFLPAAPYVPWIAAAYLVRTIGSYFRNVFLLEGKTEWDAIVVWAGASLCLAAYATLVPAFTLWGAVAATGLAFSAMFLLSFWKAQRVRWFPYEYRRMAIILIAAAVPVLLFRAMQPSHFWLRQLWAGGLACLFPGLLWCLGFLDEEEKAAIRLLWPGMTAVAHTAAQL
jgi:O-antigen/teichoic acid export membrane protein